MSHRASWRFLAGFLLVVFSSCSSFELKSSKAVPGYGMSKDSATMTFHGSYWPFSWSGSGSGPESNVIHCDEECVGIHRVEYHTNLVYALGPILTLGLWVPETVEWWCLVETPDDDDEDRYDGNESDEMEDDGPEEGEHEESR